MEVIQTSGVKIPNSLLVSGLTDTEVDEELYDFLKQYGSIQRRIPVDLPQSESGLQIIVVCIWHSSTVTFILIAIQVCQQNSDKCYLPYQGLSKRIHTCSQPICHSNVPYRAERDCKAEWQGLCGYAERRAVSHQ